MDRTIRLFFGDNLHAARTLAAEGLAADLVYLDPPFGVGQAHGARTKKGEARAHKTSVAYDDGWRGIDAFLSSLEKRLAAFRALLSPKGPGSNSAAGFMSRSASPNGPTNASSSTMASIAPNDPPTLHHGDTRPDISRTSRIASQMPIAAGATTKITFSVFTPSTFFA